MKALFENLWSRISDLAYIETDNETIQRKGFLLSLYHLLILGILSYTTVNTLLYLLFYPSLEYGIYLLEDVVMFGLFYVFWRLTKRGNISLIGHISITLTILLAIVFSDPKYLEYSMVIFALPIAISSFTLRPAMSFAYAFLISFVYILYSFIQSYVWEYNLTPIVALFALAVTTWVISQQLENAISKNEKLVKDQQKTYDELKDAYETTLEGWSKALEIRDQETQGHSKRVSDLTLRIARRMGFNDEQLVHVSRGVLLHDIGKIGIPDEILHKPGPLNEKETRIMRLHPQISVDLLSPIEYLKPALSIPKYHHEKWDGSGYPHGLSGEMIPLEARIFAIVDVYDALSHDRPYRKAWSKEKAIEYITSETGKHFDPAVTLIFLEEIEKKKR
ncbi:MAG TPA: HD-GYP domain-containing protein [Anaerolineales bacterium]|nr:HD-GYP domain-containing protein [Anaerolineales bacterium]